MEVSNDLKEPGGQVLIETIATLSGLPENMAVRELKYILNQSGKDSESVTLQELRMAMLDYLNAFQADFLKEENIEIE